MSKTRPEISVVIPVYRVEKYLRECVDSVLNQTYRDFEIILVDDGSPDGSPQICDEYAAAYSCVKVIHKQNAGQGRARNDGMNTATGRYIFFLDSDDTLREDALATLRKVVEENPEIQVVHGRLSQFESSTGYPPGVCSGEVRIINDMEGLRRTALCSFSTFPGDELYAMEDSSCATLFNLEMLRKHNIRYVSEREHISEDYVFNFDVALHAEGMAQVSDTIYNYRINAVSTTHSRNEGVMERIARYCDYIRSLMLDAGYDEATAAKYSYGYAASGIRAQYKYMFNWEVPMREKMRQAREWRALPWYEKMVSEFDAAAMSRLHRLHFRLYSKRRFRLLFMLIKGQQRVRRLLGRIKD